jgi:uncharacterized protein (TIGR02217 family)
MSDAIFPNMVGLSWGVVRSPGFNTIVHRSASQRESRVALSAYPLWTFSLSFEVLRADIAHSELQTLCGFFLARRGQYDSFLYTDPTDNSVTNQSIGIGDGVTRSYQLVRTWGSFVEPVMALNALVTPVIYVDGVPAVLDTDYTIDALGMVNFVTAPVSGATITWTGSYHYRVRFDQDVAEFEQFMRNLWELKTLGFVGSTGNKV